MANFSLQKAAAFGSVDRCEKCGEMTRCLNNKCDFCGSALKTVDEKTDSALPSKASETAKLIDDLQARTRTNLGHNVKIMDAMFDLMRQMNQRIAQLEN